MFGLPSLYLWLGGVALAAVIAGGGVGWTVHKVDQASYEALQLADANALTAQLKADQAASQAFNERAATAIEKTTSLVATLKATRVVQAQQLKTTLVAEGQKDATLAQCLDLKLPDNVLQQLAP